MFDGAGKIYNGTMIKNMKLPEEISNVLQTLNDGGYDSFVVGGCVRDELMGKDPHDYDVASAAKPEEVQNLFEKTYPVGLKHGTVLVYEDGMPVEVTTFRAESTYSDHRHPDSVVFVNTIEEDLRRRDFTINAMAYSFEKGLVDPFGGQKDIANKIVCAVGNPNDRFQEDALRMLRAFRFAAKLGFAIEENTLKAIHENEDLVKDLAAERIVKEMEGIMEADPQQLANMTEVLKDWIPQLDEALHCPQNSKYHYTDVLHHTLDAMSALEEFDEVESWALLFHDLGKMKAKTTDDDGFDHFKKHPYYSWQIARELLRKLRFPKKKSEDILALVKDHDTYLKCAPKSIYKLRIERGYDDELVHHLFNVQKADILAHTNKGKDRLKQWQEFKDYYEKEVDKHPLSINEIDIDGNDVASLGYKGRQIGTMLNRALEYAFYHPDKNHKEDLIAYLKSLKED